MKQLGVYSPVKGPTGYEILARDLLLSLSRQGVEIALEEFRHWGPFEVDMLKENHEVLSRAMAHKLEPSHRAISNLNICLPEQARYVDHARNMIYTMFETDNIPDSWIPFLENQDYIFVPTDFNHWSFTRNGQIPASKVQVLPMGFRPEVYNEAVDALPFEHSGRLLASYPIRMLVVCELTDRKNFWGTLHTFYSVAEKVGVDQCCLLMKVGNYSKVISLEEEVRRFREKLIQEKSIKDLPYAVFNYRPLLSEAAHPMFLRVATHYLSTSLGEGWDLTALQSAACGAHLFVPQHSAYQCWLKQSCASFLPITKKMAACQGGATSRLYQNSNWFAFHMPDSIELIVHALKHPESIAHKREAMKEHLKSFHWDALMPKYLEALHL